MQAREKTKVTEFSAKRKVKLGKHDQKGCAKLMRGILAKQLKRQRKAKDVSARMETTTPCTDGSNDTSMTFLDFLEQTEQFLSAATEHCVREIVGLRLAALYAMFNGKVDVVIGGETKTAGGGHASKQRASARVGNCVSDRVSN